MMTRDDGRVASGMAGTAVSPETSDPRLEAAGLSRRLALILLGGAALAACSPTSRPSGGDTLLPAPTPSGTGAIRAHVPLGQPLSHIERGGGLCERGRRLCCTSAPAGAGTVCGQV